jgi:hypothetical protein
MSEMVFQENGVLTFTSDETTQCVRFTQPLQGQLQGQRAVLTWGVQGNVLSQRLLVNGQVAISSLPTLLNRTTLNMDGFTPPYTIEVRVVPADSGEAAVTSSVTLGSKYRRSFFGGFVVVVVGVSLGCS